MRTVAFLLSLLLIFMIPWEDVVNLPGVGTVARTMGLTVAGFWVATVVITGQMRRPAPFHLVATLYVLWCAASLLWTGDVEPSLVQIKTFVQLLGLAVILWDLYTTRFALLAGLQAYILGGWVVLGNTVVNYFSGTTYYYERFSATGTNPDDLGIVLALGVPIAWYLALHSHELPLSLLLRIVNYAYVPAAFAGIALSGTRTAMIATVPGVLLGLASVTRLSLVTRILIFLFLVAAGYFLLPFIPQASFDRLGSTGSELSSGDLNGRLTLWRQGFASFADHPIMGVGLNTYRSVNSLGKLAHNTFLSVLVEVGLIGFLFFGTMLLLALLLALRQPRWDARLWLAILATWAIGASTLTWEHRKPTWLFLSLAIVSAAVVSQRDESAPLVLWDKAVGRLVQRVQARKSLLGQSEAGSY